MPSWGEGTLPPRAALLTFDDAVDDFERHALPLLRAHSAPAALFVPTAYVGNPAAAFWWDALHAAITTTTRRDPLSTPIGTVPMRTADDRRSIFRRLRDHCKEIPQAELEELVADLCDRLAVVPPPASVMDWDALAAVHAEGLVAVCPHTRTHAHLDRLTPDQIRTEIRGSIDDLEQILGPVPRAFAYPGGRMSEHVKRIAAEAGVMVAFSMHAGVERLPAVDPLALRRVNVGSRGGLTLARLRALQGGLRRTVPRRAVSQSSSYPFGAIGPHPPDDSRIVRVAMVITRWHALNLGGAERQLESLGPELARRGVQPVIIGRLRRGVEAHHDARAEVVHVRVPGLPASTPRCLSGAPCAPSPDLNRTSCTRLARCHSPRSPGSTSGAPARRS